MKSIILPIAKWKYFQRKLLNLANIVIDQHQNFDVVELGPGDAVKSLYLLKELVNKNAIDTYFPVDISNNIIDLLQKKLPEQLPQLTIHGLNGEYLSMLTSAKKISDKIKLVLFLGSNIGNIPKESVNGFCRELRSQLSVGDMVLMGVDLKKNPKQIRLAYDDSKGYTRNLTSIFLQESTGNWMGILTSTDFEHYATYDPSTGACKSYLVSLKDQQVAIGKNGTFRLKKMKLFLWKFLKNILLNKRMELPSKPALSLLLIFSIKTSGLQM